MASRVSFISKNGLTVKNIAVKNISTLIMNTTLNIINITSNFSF